MRTRLARHARAINLASPAFEIRHGFCRCLKPNTMARVQHQIEAWYDMRQTERSGAGIAGTRGTSVRVPQPHIEHFHRRVLFGIG